MPQPPTFRNAEGWSWIIGSFALGLWMHTPAAGIFGFCLVILIDYWIDRFTYREPPR